MARRYLPTHEWAQYSDGAWTMGISTHGADDIGEVVHVSLPAVGSSVSSGQACLEIESVKSIIDIHAPVTGTIAAVNEAIVDQPQLMNQSPLDAGWLVKITANEDAANNLMDEDAYLSRVQDGADAQ